MPRLVSRAGCGSLLAACAMSLPLAVPVGATMPKLPGPPPLPMPGQTPTPPAPDLDRDSNPNRGFYATDARGNLLAFSARSPRQVTARPITGLPFGVRLAGVDMRPATGDLYGTGSDSVVYRVNPQTAIAVAEAPAFNPSLSGRFFGLDFNPVVDRIRSVSDFDQNLRLHPDDGTAMQDADLNPGEPTVVGSAYTNSSFSATRPAATTLYALDAGDDTLCVQNPPNAGTLGGCLALSINVRGDAGFDIAGPDENNVGYVATGAPGMLAGSALWRVSLRSGRTTFLGRIGDADTTVTGLAAVQDSRP